MRKKPDWKEVGQFVSVLVSVFAVIRDTFKKMGVGIEIISWFAGEGKEIFVKKFLKPLGEEFLKCQKRDILIIPINYSLPLKDSIKAGNYDWKNNDITSEHFPSSESGTAEIAIKLFHFGQDITTDQVLTELDNQGYRPATLKELLALGEKFPDLQRNFPIIALGSVWQNLNGHRSCPCLYGDGSERNLDLCWFVSRWRGSCRFAAVRK